MHLGFSQTICYVILNWHWDWICALEDPSAWGSYLNITWESCDAFQQSLLIIIRVNLHPPSIYECVFPKNVGVIRVTCTWYWWSNCFDFGSGFNENWKTNMNKTGFSIKFVLFIDLPIKPENGQNGQHCHNPSYFRVPWSQTCILQHVWNSGQVCEINWCCIHLGVLPPNYIL